MEFEDIVAVATGLSKLTEVVMRLTGEFETHRSLLTQHCEKIMGDNRSLLTQHCEKIMGDNRSLLTQHCEKIMGECKEMLHEVRTSQNELKSKLLELEGSKIYVIGDVNACQNQPTMVHSQESSSLETAKDDLVDHSMENHQQNSDNDVNDMVGPGSVTSLDQFNEMPAQTNLKLIQLVEAAAIHTERENMQRGTPIPAENNSYDNQDTKTQLQAVPESDSKAINDKSLCCSITPSPSIYSTGNNPKKRRQAEMDIVKGTPPSRASCSFGTPPEKLLRCEFCPRMFEHHHSALLHMRSCKKIHDESRRIRESDSQENSFTDLITVSQSLDIGGTSKRSRDKRLLPSGQRMQKMIKCGHCERTFPTQHQVSSHERVHTGHRPYSCHVCGVKFAHGGNMIKHIKSKHPSEKPYMCRYCQNNFKTHADVLQHRKLCAVHRELLRKRSESSIYKKSRKPGREGEETVTASEDENSRPSAAAKLPPHSSVDTRQIDFNVGLISSMPILAIKQESAETAATSSPSSSLGHLHNFSYDNSTRDETGFISKTFKSETSADEHSTVPVNQLTMDRLKVEVDFRPD